MNKLAVIPARAGSTRLKNKNTYPLLGKPLIRWVTKSVICSKRFDKVLISTDSDEIFSCVEDLEVERHERPEEHATTKSTVLDAMIDLMENYETHDVFSYFLPTCPFITPEQVASGVDMLEQYRCDSVISMTEMQDTVQLACLMSQDKVLPVFDNLEAGLTNSKFIKKYYKPSGAFYMGFWDSILKYRNFFVGDTRGVLIPTDNSVDINNIEDIHYAETIGAKNGYLC